MKWTAHTPPSGFYWARVHENDQPDWQEIIKVEDDGNVWIIGQINPITPANRTNGNWIWTFWNEPLSPPTQTNDSAP